MSKQKTDTTSTKKDYLEMHVSGQKFGVPVLQVQDVLREQNVTRVPLAPREVAGSLNLRGRIVTAIDVRRRLGLPDAPEAYTGMSVVVEHNDELFSLIIDSVGDVLSLENNQLEKNPGTLDPSWRDISNGIYQLESELLVLMDVAKLLGDIDT